MAASVKAFELLGALRPGLRGRRLGGAVSSFAFLLFIWRAAQAAQVRVPEGALVRLALHYDLTTENAVKGDRVDFDVVGNVVVDERVVIPKGAVAWGKIIRVKGAGKKRTKDASVTFRFVGVRSADNQDIPLRLLPQKVKKKQAGENEVVEASPIRGLRERMIGAEKGKLYAAYTDVEVLVNAPENLTVPAVRNAPLAEPAAANPPPASPRATPAPPIPSLLGPEPAAVDFRSVPTGADIVIDGDFVGNTPSTIRLTPGEHRIEIRMGGYQRWERTMKVTPGSHPTIQAKLEKK